MTTTSPSSFADQSSTSNGAREYLSEHMFDGDLAETDRFLMALWAAGFKVVSVDDGEPS